MPKKTITLNHKKNQNAGVKNSFHIGSGARIRYAGLGQDPESSISLQHYSREVGISGLSRELLRR